MRLKIAIVKSKSYPDALSVRTEDDPEALSARSFRQALADAGFNAGDVAYVVSPDELKEDEK
jgi:hypothetical protein